MDIARNAHEYGDIHLDILTLDAKGITAYRVPNLLSLCEHQATIENWPPD